jgi:hypothetical protein
LRALNEPVINEKIFIDFNDRHEWYKNQTIIEVASKAKQYMQQYNQLMGSFHQQKHTPAPNPPQMEKQQDKHYEGGWNGGNGNGNGGNGANNGYPNNPQPWPTPTPTAPFQQPNQDPSPEQQCQVDQYKVTNIMNILCNGDKAIYLKQLCQRSLTKFYSKETKNTCNNMGIASPTNPDNVLSPAAIMPIPVAAKCAQINQQHNQQRNQAQQMMETMIGAKGWQLIAELSDIDCFYSYSRFCGENWKRSF